jgi:methionyl-tRNA formyltransferase
MQNLKIIFSGSGEFGVPTLRSLIDDGHDIVRVFTQPDRPAGRGRKLTPTPLASFALQRGLPVTPTPDINVEPLPEADLMVVIAFGQKISDPVVHHPRLGSVNLHASRLPKYRGAAPINHAILRGETVAGNSVIRLAKKMDAGAVLAMSELQIGELETAGELHDRLADDGPMIMARVIDALSRGEAVETPQDESQATLAPKLQRESTLLDWTRDPQVLARQIRGLYPWPGCRVKLLDAANTELGRLTLVRARATNGEGDRWRPGEIMTDGHVSAGPDGGVEIVELQPEGKRPMSLDAYRRGNRWQPGMRLESVV